MPSLHPSYFLVRFSSVLPKNRDRCLFKMKIFIFIISFYFCHGITCREYECIENGNCTFGYGTGPTKGFFRNQKAGFLKKKQFTQER